MAVTNVPRTRVDELFNQLKVVRPSDIILIAVDLLEKKDSQFGKYSVKIMVFTH